MAAAVAAAPRPLVRRGASLVGTALWLVSALAFTALALAGFAAYAVWDALQGANYYIAPYLSPPPLRHYPELDIDPGG